jgi:hypothetical protein
VQSTRKMSASNKKCTIEMLPCRIHAPFLQKM